MECEKLQAFCNFNFSVSLSYPGVEPSALNHVRRNQQCSEGHSVQHYRVSIQLTTNILKNILLEVEIWKEGEREAGREGVRRVGEEVKNKSNL